MWGGINRRKFPRAEYPCKITLRTKNHPDTIVSQTENIGIGGICIILPRDLGIFAPVEIQLDILDGQPVIACDGTIVWLVKSKKERNANYDTGIEFTNIKSEDEARVAFIVDRILERTDNSAP
ncbi:MAG: PilZ domain-containing protein [Candidatus Omnitrophica bacterium]|nr:PilZ domain-containing protein [Candidatus Omnitrophota bacterium]